MIGARWLARNSTPQFGQLIDGGLWTCSRDIISCRLQTRHICLVCQCVVTTSPRFSCHPLSGSRIIYSMRLTMIWPDDQCPTIVASDTMIYLVLTRTQLVHLRVSLCIGVICGSHLAFESADRIAHFINFIEVGHYPPQNSTTLANGNVSSLFILIVSWRLIFMFGVLEILSGKRPSSRGAILRCSNCSVSRWLWNQILLFLHDCVLCCLQTRTQVVSGTWFIFSSLVLASHGDKWELIELWSESPVRTHAFNSLGDSCP